MNYKKEYIKKALDTTNGFFSTQSEAVAVNPNIWDFRLRDYQEKNLIVTPLAEQFDFRGAGVDYKVTIDEAPSAAAALTETVDVTISAFATRNTTFTPTEYGAAYQLTRKEAVRAFFNVAERMVKKLGYSLAQKKDALAVTCLQTYAGNTVMPASKTAATALQSTDTLDYDSILRGKNVIESAYYTPMDLLINYTHKQQLLNLGTVNKANEFGTRDAIQKGLVGELFGLRVWASHSIPTVAATGAASTDVIQNAKAVILGETGTGEKAFGYAIKRDPIIEKEYHARGRFWDIVAHEEYDFQMLHAEAVCLIQTAA